MSKKMKKLVLLAVAQSAKGVPGVPVPGTNAILCKGFMPNPIDGKFVERNLIQGAKGNFGGIFAGEHCQFDFEVEWAGSGAAGTAPKFAPLNLACGLSETVAAGVSAAYQPVDDIGTYLTIYAYLDGLLFQMTDAIGSKSWTINSEEIPVQKFSFMGVYVPMTDATFPTGIAFTGFTKPLTVGKVNTPIFTLDGISLVTKSFGMDLANQNAWRNWIGDSGAKSPDRKPTGSAVFELTTVAIKNWGEAVRLGTEMPLVITHGIAAGNICGLTAPKLQINAKPTITDDSGTALLSCTFAVMPNAGNDELVETFR
jgi:hypothetical protein